jgi:putative glutamine amidotransferase
MIPLIGITTYVAHAAWGAWERPAGVLPESYYELVASAGGRPLLLPPLRTAASGPAFGAEEVISALDGLVLTGGGDVDPNAYGETPDPSVGGVNPVRDESERALLAAALKADLPVLAICRGLQVLNVELGGTLHQNVPDVYGNEGHRSAPSVFGEVQVSTEPGSRAAGVFGDGPTVLCSHHQSIHQLGDGLRATAHAGDGVIEAVELRSAAFVLGVQWHPEEGGDQRPFAALIAAAQEFHQREETAGRR